MTKIKAMALFRKVLLAVLGGIVLLIITSAGLFIWGTNGGTAEGWFKGLLSDPIPASVAELQYGGIGGFDSIRCFAFRISPADLESLLKAHSAVKEGESESGKRRVTYVFQQYSKIPVGDLQGYEAFSSEEYTDGGKIRVASRLFLVNPSKNHVYCLVET
jgi:hypothetical protein